MGNEESTYLHDSHVHHDVVLVEVAGHTGEFSSQSLLSVTSLGASTLVVLGTLSTKGIVVLVYEEAIAVAVGGLDLHLTKSHGQVQVSGRKLFKRLEAISEELDERMCDEINSAEMLRKREKQGRKDD